MLREEIAGIVGLLDEGTCIYGDSSCLYPEAVGCVSCITDQIRALFRQKVEGIENPHKGKRGHTAQETAFDAAIQAVLELLKEEK